MNSKPSKSARKRESLALQNLGEQLIELAPVQLKSVALNNELFNAIMAAKSMHTHGALRRQKQLIGKLMRRTDPAPITAALDALHDDAQREKEVFRQAEYWRERLIVEGKNSRKEFAEVVAVSNESLDDALDDWLAAPNDKVRRLARRKIFREIHKDLKSKMQNEARSI